jgi:adenine-specific DNA methylase
MNEKTTDEDETDGSDAPEKVAIEGKLPLAAIDIESQKDMSSGGFHPLLSLHKWFAARPVPASRAAVLASMLPENIDDDELLKLMQIGPKGMEDGISEHLQTKFTESKKGKSFEQHYGYANPATQSPTDSQIENLHTTLRDAWGDNLPTILDPTSGRGIIPFEALRYDIPTRANELNPVAYLITKVGLEYASNLGSLQQDLEKYRDKIHKEAKSNIEPYYPTEQPENEILNSAFTHLIHCDACDGELPLVRNWWINKSSGKDAIKPIYKEGSVEFKHVQLDKTSSEEFDPSNGTVSRGGAECPHCGVVKQTKEIRAAIEQGNFEYRIYGVSYADSQGNWCYRAGTEVDAQGMNKASERIESDFDLIDFLAEPIPSGFNTSQIKRYGMDEWRDIFTPRQLVSHYEYLSAFEKFAPEIRGKYDDKKADAILTILGLFASRVIEFNCRLAKWRMRYGTGSRIFTDNNLALKFTAVDNNISAPRRGYYDRSEQVIEAYEELVSYLPDNPSIETSALDAAKLSQRWENNSVDVAVVDPPYYSSIQYAELSDVFYIVLKRYLSETFPSLFESQLSDKENEAVANPTRYEGVASDEQSKKELADDKYEEKMEEIFSEVHNLLTNKGVITVMFTHRDMDAWDTLSTAFIRSGFTITATHPVKTERADRVGLQGKASADSSIFLVGRKRNRRPDDAQPTLWENVKNDIQQAARNEAEEILSSGYNISKTDTAIAAYGPTLQKYAESYPVVNKKGETVRPREALSEAREAVTSVLADQFLDTEGLEELDSLTRWYTLAWLIYETDTFPYDEGRQLGVAAGIDIDKIKSSTKIWGKSSGDIQLKTHADRVQDIVLLKNSSADNPSSRKYPVNPTETRFTYTIDTVHAALHVYEREGARAAWNWLSERGLKSNKSFKIAITALIEVLPADTDMYNILVDLVAGETGDYLDINLDHIDMSGQERQTELGDHQ